MLHSSHPLPSHRSCSRATAWWWSWCPRRSTGASRTPGSPSSCTSSGEHRTVCLDHCHACCLNGRVESRTHGVHHHPPRLQVRGAAWPFQLAVLCLAVLACTPYALPVDPCREDSSFMLCLVVCPSSTRPDSVLLLSSSIRLCPAASKRNQTPFCCFQAQAVGTLFPPCSLQGAGLRDRGRGGGAAGGRRCCCRRQSGGWRGGRHASPGGGGSEA